MLATQDVVQKRYTAMVFGSMEHDEGRIELPIRKDMDNPPKQVGTHVILSIFLSLWNLYNKIAYMGPAWSRDLSFLPSFIHPLTRHGSAHLYVVASCVCRLWIWSWVSRR